MRIKPGKKITIIFHNSSIEHWKYFQEVVNIDGLRPLISDIPERLISSAKTSTQYQSENDSQCFLAFNFIKDSNYRASENIKEMDDIEYCDIVEKTKNKAIEKGYENKCDQFDFIINEFLFKYKFKSDFRI